MEWLYNLFLEHSALQAVVVLSLISAIGLGLGRVHFWGVSLGVTFVFFAGILAGHFGLSVDPQMLNYAESFGLVIFVYSLGLHVGPGFFSSVRNGGVTLNMLALAVVLLGTLLTVVASYATGVLPAQRWLLKRTRLFVTRNVVSPMRSFAEMRRYRPRKGKKWRRGQRNGIKSEGPPCNGAG